MLTKMNKLGLAALTTIAFAGTAMADHHEEVMDDACSAADDMMGDACAAGDDMMGDACAAGDDMMGDACAAGDDMMDGDMGDHHGDSPMSLGAGKIEIGVSVPISLSADFVGDPVSISPDIWYGVNDKLRVGLVHSAYGMSNYWVGAGTSLCISGDLCGDVYSAGGLRALYGLSHSASMNLEADVGVNWRSIDPLMLGLRIGVKGSYTAGKIMVGFNPAVNVGLTERDAGNKELLTVPVDVGFMATPEIWAGVQTGINGALDGFGDAYQIPLNLGAMYMLNHQTMVGAGFGFGNIAGKNSSADNRAISLMASYRL